MGMMRGITLRLFPNVHFVSESGNFSALQTVNRSLSFESDDESEKSRLTALIQLPEVYCCVYVELSTQLGLVWHISSDSLLHH